MSSVKGKKLLILGGASQHCKVVEAAKRLGVETYVADYLPSAPAKDMADHSYQINVTETERLAELCRAERIDGVISGWLDFCQVPYQRLCEAVGLPCYGTREQFDVLTNKVRFKHLCERFGVGHPEAFEWQEWVGGAERDLPRAVFVKPADSRGSRGASVCRTSRELEAAIEIAKNESYDGKAIAERYIEGARPFLAVYFFVNGRPVLQQLSDACFGDPEYGMEKINVAYSSPCRSYEVFLERAQAPFLRAMKALGVKNGPVCVQGFMTDEEVLFFDPGRRFPGGEYERAFKRLTGIDLVEAMIEFALTGNMPENDALESDAFLLGGRYATRLQLNVRGGLVGDVSGFDFVSNMPEVEHIAFYHASGDQIAESGNVQQRFAQVVLVADSREQMNKAIDEVYAHVSVLDENGAELIVATSSEIIAGGGIVIKDAAIFAKSCTDRNLYESRYIDWAMFPRRRSAVVLAGGLPQRELVLSLKKRGYRSAVVDWNRHAPAEAAAAVYYQESTLDEEAVTQIVLRERAEVLTTCCTDQALCTMGRVADALSISSYLSSEESFLVTNKLAMKRKFQKLGIPSARFIENPATTEDYSVFLPAVVKPVDCNSSKGVIEVHSAYECTEAVRTARELSRTGGVIVEELLSGPEYSIDAFVLDGEPIILCVSRSDKLDRGNGFVICRGQYIPQEFQRLHEECKGLAHQIVKGFGLNNCPLLIQAIETDEGLRILEFSARTGGSIKYRMIELVSGVNVIDATADLICGIKPCVHPVMSRNVVSDEFLYCGEGRIAEIRGLDECKEKGLIKEFYILKPPGSVVSGARNSGDRVAAFVVTAESVSSYRETLSQVMAEVDVDNDRGESLLIH